MPSLVFCYLHKPQIENLTVLLFELKILNGFLQTHFSDGRLTLNF